MRQNYDESDDESLASSVGNYDTGVHGDFMEGVTALKKLRELNDRFQFLGERHAELRCSVEARPTGEKLRLLTKQISRLGQDLDSLQYAGIGDIMPPGAKVVKDEVRGGVDGLNAACDDLRTSVHELHHQAKSMQRHEVNGVQDDDKGAVEAGGASLEEMANSTPSGLAAVPADIDDCSVDTGALASSQDGGDSHANPNEPGPGGATGQKKVAVFGPPPKLVPLVEQTRNSRSFTMPSMTSAAVSSFAGGSSSSERTRSSRTQSEAPQRMSTKSRRFSTLMNARKSSVPTLAQRKLSVSLGLEHHLGGSGSIAEDRRGEANSNSENESVASISTKGSLSSPAHIIQQRPDPRTVRRQECVSDAAEHVRAVRGRLRELELELAAAQWQAARAASLGSVQ